MAIDCVWAKWGQYSKCSKSCGKGVQTRVRSKAVEAENGGLECTGLARQSKQCIKKPCSKYNFLSKCMQLKIKYGNTIKTIILKDFIIFRFKMHRKMPKEEM